MIVCDGGGEGGRGRLYLRMTSRFLAQMAGATNNTRCNSVWVRENEEFCLGYGFMKYSDGDV